MCLMVRGGLDSGLEFGVGNKGGFFGGEGLDEETGEVYL
ncbi:hypothetical protein A2U01_0060468, partial [Trifolium medium]|nr:hypothetical protein [Trifolium medium]